MIAGIDTLIENTRAQGIISSAFRDPDDQVIGPVTLPR